MDDSLLEITTLGLGVTAPGRTALITPTSAPIFIGRDTNQVDASGTPAADQAIWVVGGVDYENGQLDFGNRTHAFLEETHGVFLGATWEQGPWTVDGHLTKSEATNNFLQINIYSNIRAHAQDPDGNNGVNGSVFTGLTNYKTFSWETEDPSVFQFLDSPWPAIAPDSNQTFSRFTGANAQNGGEERFGVTGGAQLVDRDFESIDSSALYDIDNLPWIDSVKFGVRYAKDTLNNAELRNTQAGIDVDAISNDFYQAPFYTTRAPFFNGGMPNFLSYERGWWSLRNQFIIDELQDGIEDRMAPGRVRVPGTGFVATTNLGEVQAGRNFTAELSSTAIFAMVNLYQEFGAGYSMSGNVGVRQVDSSTDNTGLSIEYDENFDEVRNQISRNLEYSNTLPSLNLKLETPHDVIVRFAAYRGMVRPNLRSNTPAVAQRIGDVDGRDAFTIELPRDQVRPFTADSIDLSFAWYNREGSAIAIALYEKDIKGFIQTTQLCPSSGIVPLEGTDGINIGSTLSISSDGLYCELDMPIPLDEDNDPATPDVLYEVANITTAFNSDREKKIRGVELQLQQNLDFLPEPWNGFGGQFSYTWLDDDSSSGAGGAAGEDEGGGFDGISEDSYNIIAYWENETVSARFSYNWRSSYSLGTSNTTASGTFGGGAREVRPRGQLDFNLTYRITDDLRFYFKGFNLTDEVYREYQDTYYLPRRTNYDGRTYSLTASYSF